MTQAQAQAVNKTPARPILNQTAGVKTLAQASEAAKALKPVKTPAAVKPVVDSEAIAKAKADAKAKAETAKSAASMAKAVAHTNAIAIKEVAKAKAAEAKQAATEAKLVAKAEADKAKADATATKQAAREEAKAARIAAGGNMNRLVPADLSTYHVDKECKTVGGHPSVDSNDDLAKELRGLGIDAVYAEAAKILKEPEADLRSKYAHLNVGMQRMNLGNRMRAAVMKVNQAPK